MWIKTTVPHLLACIALSSTGWADEAADLAAAKSQSAAMAKAKTTLKAAVDKAEQGLAGSRAVSVTPELKGGHAVAMVSLLKGGKYTSASEPLE